jgi:hypothetical protein
MTITTITPSIDVTIGGLTRLYHAFVTTGAVSLDAPATLTLYTGFVGDVAGFAAEPTRLEVTSATSPARVVLVDSSELAWQRARYRQHGDLITPVDVVLVGMATLQQWLWQRLSAQPLPAAAARVERGEFCASRTAPPRLAAGHETT